MVPGQPFLSGYDNAASYILTWHLWSWLISQQVFTACGQVLHSNAAQARRVLLPCFSAVNKMVLILAVKWLSKIQPKFIDVAWFAVVLSSR